MTIYKLMPKFGIRLLTNATLNVFDKESQGIRYCDCIKSFVEYDHEEIPTDVDDDFQNIFDV